MPFKAKAIESSYEKWVQKAFLPDLCQAKVMFFLDSAILCLYFLKSSCSASKRRLEQEFLLAEIYRAH